MGGVEWRVVSRQTIATAHKGLCFKVSVESFPQNEF